MGEIIGNEVEKGNLWLVKGSRGERRREMRSEGN